MKKRRHLGIHAQVLTIAVVPALIVTLILILVVYRGNVLQINRVLNQQGQMLVAQLAASLEYALSTGAAEQIPPAIEATVSPATEVLKTQVKRVRVFDSDDRLLHTAPPIGLSHEITDAFFTWTSFAEESRTFSAPIYLQPVDLLNNENEPQTRRYLGKVQLDISTVPIKAEAFGHLIRDIGLVLGIFASALLLAHAIGRRLSGTIREAAQAIGRIKAGDLSIRLAKIESNEVGTLQEGVNLLAESIASAREKLETELAKVRAEYTQTLDELRVQTQEAQKANETKSLFLAKVSHEMRTPLYSIQGLAEQLLKSRPNADEARTVNTLLKATHHLYQTISDILDFTQLERKRYIPQMTPLDLWHEIENVIETLGPLVSKQNLYLDLIVDPNVPPTVTGDGKAFRTIVTNLISNAIKFTKTGGICIELGVESSQPDWTTSLRLQVSDTGQGIPPENLKTIFAPFEQVEEALNRRYEGTGLGLSIVKGYCKALGGHIDVESQPGQCTTFTVVLPFKMIHANHKLINLPLVDELIGLNSLVADERSTFRASVHCRLASLGVNVSEQAVSVQVLSTMTPPKQSYDLLVVRDLSLRPPKQLSALNEQLTQWAHYILSLNTRDNPTALQQLRQQGMTVALWNGATRKTLHDELSNTLFGNAPVRSVEQNIFKIQKYLQGKSVLVVEDFDINRSIMTDQLQSNGLVVVEACDGDEAVALASTTNLDLILMDIQMPGKDGIQAITEIRAMPSRAKRPIIGFTASADKRTNQRVIDAGANAVLTKPISENELITAIHKTLITTASAFRRTTHATLAIYFLFGGTLLFWYGLLLARYLPLILGAAVMGAAFTIMLFAGYVSPVVLPALVLVAGLAWSLKWVRHRVWQVLGWTLYVIVVLALGFRLFPQLSPVPVFEALDGEALYTFQFPPEKVILLWLVPTLVLAPWASRGFQGFPNPDQPRITFILVLAATLLTLLPVALGLNYIRPGLAVESVPYLIYWLSYNLVFVCILEESFFRGILQNALVRGFSHIGLTYAAPLGVFIAALLFGLAHFGGGWTYVFLAALAGIGYGMVYYLTGRLHYAVLIHFAVNTVHKLVFAGPIGG